MRNEYGAWKVYKIPIESTRLFLAERNLIINKKERKKKRNKKIDFFLLRFVSSPNLDNRVKKYCTNELLD